MEKFYEYHKNRLNYKAIEPMTRDAERLAENPKSHQNTARWVASNTKVVV